MKSQKHDNLGKVYYVGYYVDEFLAKEYNHFPSALPKMNYIINAVKKSGHNIEVVSLCTAKANRVRFRKVKIDNNEEHLFFSSVAGFRKIRQLMLQLNVFFYLIFHLRANDKVIIYHSLSYKIWLKVFLTFFRSKCIVEVEELYSYVNKGWENRRRREIDLINSFDYHICVNERIASTVTNGKNKAILSYGSYYLPNYNKHIITTDEIHLVYAGVIESNRNAACLAVEAMKYLPSNYKLHVLGFGNEEDIQKIKSKMQAINSIFGEKCEFCGEMHGEEYYSFLQKCNIGLSTHQYFPSDMLSADYSFPSKILTYMANGLKVVAQKIESLTNSSISDFITYYIDPKPEEIAKAIISVNTNDGYDGRKIISKLDQSFCCEIKKLLER